MKPKKKRAKDWSGITSMLAVGIKHSAIEQWAFRTERGTVELNFLAARSEW